MRVRFPLLYMIELQNSLQQQVEERTRELKEEKNNSEKLLIELTQALATTIDANLRQAIMSRFFEHVDCFILIKKRKLRKINFRFTC